MQIVSAYVIDDCFAKVIFIFKFFFSENVLTNLVTNIITAN